ncbi:hypothetical protein [Streptomyces sp. NPDC007984]
MVLAPLPAGPPADPLLTELTAPYASDHAQTWTPLRGPAQGLTGP